MSVLVASRMKFPFATGPVLKAGPKAARAPWARKAIDEAVLMDGMMLNSFQNVSN